MRIYNRERQIAIKIISKNHNCSWKQAEKLVDELNGDMKELTKKLRKIKKNEQKDKTKSFIKAFRELKMRRKIVAKDI